MKYWTLLILMVGSSFRLAAGGIEFFHGTWEEALELAKVQEKVIFVDAYTTWCGPCKRMAKTVFTQETVGEFYNANFINMKIDMEKPAGLNFQDKYPVTAYPTLYYIDGKGEVVLVTKGGRNPEQFIELGRSVLGKADNSADYAEKYESGERDPEFVFKYVKALNKAGKPSLKVSNEYLKTQKDLTTDFNLRFIYEATVEADSRIFDLLVEHRKRIEQLKSPEDVSKKIKEACKKTAMKAVEYEVIELHDEAKDKLAKHLGKEGQQLAMELDMNYHRLFDDPASFLKVCDKYIKQFVKKDASQMHQLAMDIKISFHSDSKAMKQAEKLAKKAAKNGGLFQYYFTYSEILLHNGKKQEALKMANESLKRTDGNRGLEQNANRLIEKIKAS